MSITQGTVTNASIWNGQQGALNSYQTQAYVDPWMLKVRRLENGYLITSGNKEYLCPDGADIGDAVKNALVMNRVTG